MNCIVKLPYNIFVPEHCFQYLYKYLTKNILYIDFQKIYEAILSDWIQYKVLGRITYHYKIWPSSCEHILFLPFFYISSSFISGWLLCNVWLLFVAAVMCCRSGWACTANLDSGIDFHFKYWGKYLLFMSQITFSRE